MVSPRVAFGGYHLFGSGRGSLHPFALIATKRNRKGPCDLETGWELQKPKLQVGTKTLCPRNYLLSLWNSLSLSLSPHGKVSTTFWLVEFKHQDG